MARYTIYKFFIIKCEICGCPKAEHCKDNYYYGYETVATNKDNQQQKQNELEESEEKKNE